MECLRRMRVLVSLLVTGISIGHVLHGNGTESRRVTRKKPEVDVSTERETEISVFASRESDWCNQAY